MPLNRFRGVYANLRRHPLPREIPDGQACWFLLECPGSPSSGSVAPGRECLAEMTVFVRESGSLSPGLISLSVLPKLDRTEKIFDGLLVPILLGPLFAPV